MNKFLSRQLHTRQAKGILLVLALLMTVGAFFRFWNFSNTLMFQGDQGRDALIVAQIFRIGDPVFIGPVTSIGNMYLGPFYYYFMLPFLWLSYPSPIGPALAVAVVSWLTIPLIYFLGKEMIGKRAALFGAFFFAFSSIVVEYSRFSWNPNLAPLFGLLLLFFTYRALKQSPWYWVAVALSFGLVIQLHYLALLAGAAVGLVWLKEAQSHLIRPKKKTALPFILATIASVVTFLSTLVPLALFDLKHEYVNAKAFGSLFTKEQAFTGDEQNLLESSAHFIVSLWTRSQQVLLQHFFTDHGLLLTLSLLLTVGVVMLLLYKWRKSVQGFQLLLLFLVTSLIGMAFYQHTIFPHYFAYLFPLICLFWGGVTASFTRLFFTWPVATLMVLSFLVFNIPKMPLQTLGWTISDVRATTDEITSHLAPGEKYSLVLLGPSKDLYAHNYRFYLSSTDSPALPLERSAEADTLVVINEERIKNVAGVPIYEIVIFPEKTEPEVYTIPNGPEIVIYRRK